MLNQYQATLLIFASFLSALSYANASCPPRQEIACLTAKELATELGNSPPASSVRPHTAKLTYLSVRARGANLEFTARMPLLLEEMIFLDKKTNGEYFSDWAQSTLTRSMGDICGRVPLVSRLLENGGKIRNVFLSLDDVPVTTTEIADCTSGASIDIPRATFKKLAERRHNKAISWLNLKNLYIYGDDPLGCYLSELGTIASPWGNRVAETHSRWSHSEKMNWVSRTTYSAEGDIATYFHVGTEAECLAFKTQADKRR